MDAVLSPGPLLDAKIARTLWRALVIHDAEADHSYLMGEDFQQVPLPHYSTDIDDAHRVVSFMKSQGWTMSLKHESAEGRDDYVVLFGKPDGRTYLWIKASTIPQAICLAALWALSGTNVKSD